MRLLLLGCSGYDPLQSLDFSLGLERIMLPRHLLVSKASILHAVRVVEHEPRFLRLVVQWSAAANKVEEAKSHLFDRVSPPPTQA